MFYYVYKITDKKTNKFYIGARCSKITPDSDLGIKYFSSSKIVKYLISINGVDNFIFEIINDTFTSWKETYDYEQSIIFANWGDSQLLNKSCYYGKKDFGVISSESKQMISKKSLEMWKNDEMVNKIKISQKNSWTPERKKTQSERLKKEFWTDERKLEHSEKMKGHIGSIKLRGVKKPDGFGKKISNKLKNKPKTQNHKENLSKSRTGKTYPNIRKLTPNQILEIYHKLLNGENYNKIKSDYNISTSMVYRIKNGVIKP
jgi:hypothetical protein